jgi:magnesium-transporting ATPase (P-type)
MMNGIKRIWQSPVLVVGIIANLLIAVSTVRFFRLPRGSGVDYEDWLFSFVVPISLLAFVIGVVLWGKDTQQEGKKPTILDNIGLVLNLIPFGLALSLLSLAFTVRGLWDDT